MLHIDPKISAQSAVDKHVVKMILESVQLLYTAYHLTNPDLLKTSPYQVYKITHKNHPSAKWCRENYSNFYWLLCLAWEYCLEYTYRYDKEHTCQKHIIWMIQNMPNLPMEPMTLLPQAMPDKYKCKDSIQAYRNYYLGDKLRFAKYTRREPPEWFAPYLQK